MWLLDSVGILWHYISRALLTSFQELRSAFASGRHTRTNRWKVVHSGEGGSHGCRILEEFNRESAYKCIVLRPRLEEFSQSTHTSGLHCHDFRLAARGCSHDERTWQNEGCCGD